MKNPLNNFVADEDLSMISDLLMDTEEFGLFDPSDFEDEDTSPNLDRMADDWARSHDSLSLEEVH